MAALPRLYGYDLSHYVVAAERMLAYKGVRHRRVPVPYHDKRELVRATGQDYVPALVWGGTVVTWEEIPDFLEGRVPEPTLFPNGSKALATALENWAHQVVEERVWRYVVTRMPATFRDEVERWVFEEMQSRVRGPFEVLARRRPEFRREMFAYLGLVDRMLADREYVLGTPSVADFGLFGSIWPIRYIGEPLPPRFRRLARWYDRLRRIPSTAVGGRRPAR